MRRRLAGCISGIWLVLAGVDASAAHLAQRAGGAHRSTVAGPHKLARSGVLRHAPWRDRRHLFVRDGGAGWTTLAPGQRPVAFSPLSPDELDLLQRRQCGMMFGADDPAALPIQNTRHTLRLRIWRTSF